MAWPEFVLTLLFILLAAEIFVNALEHLGERLHISEGVTGSLFAAIGTALPETLVPLLAFAGGDAANREIGTGAILGAPLMLSTLSISLLGWVSLRKRGTHGIFHAEKTGFTRDLNTFLLAFSLAALALFLPRDMPTARIAIAFVLLLMYFIHILLTLRASAKLVASGHGTEAENPLHFQRYGLALTWWLIIVQLMAGLGLLILSAKGFIASIHTIAPQLGIPPLLLSLLLVPVATELPEKINSIVWVRRQKDTLAFGNITGALVFQGTLLPAIGMLATDWQAQPSTLASVAITLLGAGWLRLCIARGKLKVWQLWGNSALYLAYLFISLFISLY